MSYPLFTYWDPPLIKLSHHDPSWAIEFQTQRSRLLKGLSGLPIHTIEHVGSTSIPNLLAKPILDIDIVISESDFPAICERLIELGYAHVGESGLAGRHAFFQPGADRETGIPCRRVDVEVLVRDEKGREEMRVVSVVEAQRNTYVCFEGSLSLRNHRDLKRVLMEDRELRKEYGTRKAWLVENYQYTVLERTQYNKGKNDIVREILKKAGWNDEDLDKVCKNGGYWKM